MSNNNSCNTYTDENQMHNIPYNHFIFPRVFDNEIIPQIKSFFNSSVFNISDEKDDNNRFVYTAKKTDYGKSNLITKVVDTLINKQTIEFYNNIFKDDGIDLFSPETLHAIYFSINYTGYKTLPHIDNNKLLTMLIYFPEDCKEELGTELLDEQKNFIKRIPYKDNVGCSFPCYHNTGPTYHSYTKHIPSRRCTIMYNIFKNKSDYITSYDKGNARDIIMRSKLKKEINTHLFSTGELIK